MVTIIYIFKTLAYPNLNLRPVIKLKQFCII